MTAAKSDDKDDAVSLAHRWIRGEVLSRPQFDQVASELIRLNRIAPLPECGTPVQSPNSAAAIPLSGETPRTDAAWKDAGSVYRDGEWQAFSPTEGKGWALARQLERELAEAHRYSAEQGKLIEASVRSTSGAPQLEFLIDEQKRQHDEIIELRGLLKRIRQWDMMDTAADGVYWRKEIDSALSARQP